MNNTMLKVRAKNLGLTIKKLSQETEVGYSSLCMFFNGYQNLPLEKQEKVEKYIRCIEELSSFEPKETNNEKITRLCKNCVLILNEVLRTVNSGKIVYTPEEPLKSFEDDEEAVPDTSTPDDDEEEEITTDIF